MELQLYILFTSIYLALLMEIGYRLGSLAISYIKAKKWLN